MKTTFKFPGKFLVTILLCLSVLAAYASCTVTWTGTFTTEAGNTYTGTIKATASTCEKAGAGIDKVIARYKAEM